MQLHIFEFKYYSRRVQGFLVFLLVISWMASEGHEPAVCLHRDLRIKITTNHFCLQYDGIRSFPHKYKVCVILIKMNIK